MNLYWTKKNGKTFLVKNIKDALLFSTEKEAFEFSGLKDRVIKIGKKFAVKFGYWTRH